MIKVWWAGAHSSGTSCGYCYSAALSLLLIHIYDVGGSLQRSQEQHKKHKQVHYHPKLSLNLFLGSIFEYVNLCLYIYIYILDSIGTMPLASRYQTVNLRELHCIQTLFFRFLRNNRVMEFWIKIVRDNVGGQLWIAIPRPWGIPCNRQSMLATFTN